jgi:hypothetical protein
MRCYAAGQLRPDPAHDRFRALAATTRLPIENGGGLESALLDAPRSQALLYLLGEF